MYIYMYENNTCIYICPMYLCINMTVNVCYICFYICLCICILYYVYAVFICTFPVDP